MAEASEKSRLPSRFRRLIRVLHRDFGYLAVGLTLVYALSGLAVNHIADWDPSFREFETRTNVGALPSEPQAAARAALRAMHVAATPREVYESEPGRVDVVFDDHTIHVDTRRGVAVDEGRRPRFVLRLANWLHLNRGKKAWTYIADTYAAALLFLAVSGLFMLPGKQGVFGRGGFFLLAGLAVPVAYVALSGGP